MLQMYMTYQEYACADYGPLRAQYASKLEVTPTMAVCSPSSSGYVVLLCILTAFSPLACWYQHSCRYFVLQLWELLTGEWLLYYKCSSTTVSDF